MLRCRTGSAAGRFGRESIRPQDYSAANQFGRRKIEFIIEISMQTSWGSGKECGGTGREGGNGRDGRGGRGEGNEWEAFRLENFSIYTPGHWPNYYVRTSAQLFRSASREQDSIGMLYIQGW